MSETTFAAGFFFEKPREGAPDFVRGRMSVKVEEAIAFLQANKNEKGYCNLDLLKSKDGKKLYFTLNAWKKEETKAQDTDEVADQSDTPF